MYVQAHLVSEDPHFKIIDKEFHVGFFPEVFDLMPGQTYCISESEDERWVCTRPEGHPGIHMAGVGVDTFGAYWDEKGAYKESKKDFFESLGL